MSKVFVVVVFVVVIYRNQPFSFQKFAGRRKFEF